MPHFLEDHPDWPTGKERRNKPRHPIRLVPGTEFCLYSPLQQENKTITENQRVLYDKLIEIEDRLKALWMRGNPPEQF